MNTPPSNITILIWNFTSALSRKWPIANRTKHVFKAHNKEWLVGEINFLGNLKNSNNIDVVGPSSSISGRPSKDFEENSEGAKFSPVFFSVNTTSNEELMLATWASFKYLSISYWQQRKNATGTQYPLLMFQRKSLCKAQSTIQRKWYLRYERKLWGKEGKVN